LLVCLVFFFQAEDGIRDFHVTGVQTCALPIWFVAAGIPLVVSINFAKEEMPEAGYGTDGHLVTIVGFTADGDPVINDPNKASDRSEERRVGKECRSRGARCDEENKGANV